MTEEQNIRNLVIAQMLFKKAELGGFLPEPCASTLKKLLEEKTKETIKNELH